jgi:hypothetical protein
VDGHSSKLPQSDLYRCARRGLCQWILCDDGHFAVGRFRRRFGLWDVLPALDPHFVPIKKSSLTKPRPGEGDLSLRHGFLGYDGDGHTSTLQQVNCHYREPATSRKPREVAHPQVISVNAKRQT